MLAEDDDAERHSGNGTNDLRGNSAGKRDPGRSNLIAFPRPFQGRIFVHGNTFARC
jgi:hypothetical protein